AMSFSPDGETLASAGDDCCVKLWGVATGKEKKSWQAHALAVYSLAFTPDGKQLATCSGDSEEGASGEVKLWDAASAKEIRTLRGFVREAWCVTFSPSGKYLAVGAGKPITGKWPTVRVCEVATGKEVADFELGPYVRCLAFSPDEKTLVA